MARSAGFNFTNDFSLGRRRGLDPQKPFPQPESQDYSPIVEGVFGAFNTPNETFQGMVDHTNIAGTVAKDRAIQNARTTFANAAAQADVTSAEVTKRRLEDRKRDLQASIDNQVTDQTNKAIGAGVGTAAGMAASFIPGVGPIASTALRFAGPKLGEFVGGLFS